jgi:UDP:flavonoid glycosyltransferase YjiC (YdhE family)
LFGRLATAAMLPAMNRVITRWKPDIVLRDPCEYASAVIANRLGIPTAQIAIGLADVEWASIDIAAPALEAHRPGLTHELRVAPYVTRFPASLDPSLFPDTRRFREVAPRVVPLPDWWNGSRAPLVYVSFGTVLGHMSIAAETYRVALAAVTGIDVRVLLTVGHRFDLSQLGELPSNVHVEPWVDQADVFAEAEVVVCHGGSGTTFGALAAGVPVVIVPLFADQFANSLKVAEAEAGLALNTHAHTDGGQRPLSRADAVSIADAITTVRGNSSFRQHAQRIAAEMAHAPTADDLLNELTTIQ